jgi:glycosyltransferase involved in cell wall biosynthesis
VNVGLLLPGFSADENDWAIPVQHTLVRELSPVEDVRVLALRYPHRRDRYRVYGASVYSLGVGQVRGGKRLALWWGALRTLRQMHHEKLFDVLHAMWADETGLIAAWAGKWLGVPVVVSIAGGELVGFGDIGYGLQRSAFSRWIVGQALHGADGVIAACNYTQRLISQNGYDVPEGRVRTITLGVDTDLFHPTPELCDPTRLIHAASLVGVKDQATLLRAVARLPDVTLDIAGEGVERARLVMLAEQLGISHRVNFLGAVTHLEMPTYYRRSALNVLSSRHEGLGMVTLEAAASGLPTVSTAVGLLSDYPELGVAVPVGDEQALADAIRALLDDPERRARLRESARETVMRQFTIQRTVEQLRSLYSELSERRRP